MSFHKRYISKHTITTVADNDDYIQFYNYFIKPDAIITMDDYSTKIFNSVYYLRLRGDKNKIIRIMNSCKKTKNKIIFEKIKLKYNIISEKFRIFVKTLKQ